MDNLTNCIKGEISDDSIQQSILLENYWAQPLLLVNALERTFYLCTQLNVLS